MGATVLLIEDNFQNRYLATFLLEGQGLKVVPAPDGATALHLAESVAPELILLDIQLPLMDGYQVARAIRKKPTLKTVPIVAVTSFAMSGDREKALAAGCDGYIEKPINPDTFVDEVMKFLPAPSC